jgi:hypothetical protein
MMISTREMNFGERRRGLPPRHGAGARSRARFEPTNELMDDRSLARDRVEGGEGFPYQHWRAYDGGQGKIPRWEGQGCRRPQGVRAQKLKKENVVFCADRSPRDERHLPFHNSLCFVVSPSGVGLLLQPGSTYTAQRDRSNCRSNLCCVRFADLPEDENEGNRRSSHMQVDYAIMMVLLRPDFLRNERAVVARGFL